jgi:hypothetical protein
MVKFTYSIPALAAIAALAIAGCGGSGSSTSASELAGLASPGSAVFVEGTLKPTGELKSSADAVAKKVAGVSSLHDFVVSKLESRAKAEGEPLDFASEVEPWLGSRASVAFEQVMGGELSEPLIAAEVTNVKAAQDFVEKRAGGSGEQYKRVTYEGSTFEVGGPEGNAIGTIGEALVLAGGEKEFKAAVDSSNGESLGDESRFQQAMDSAVEGSLADVYVDLGTIFKQSGDQIDPQARALLEGSGIDASEATAVASVIPHSEQIEVDLSSELGGEKAPTGDASQLLGSMPADSVAAFATSGFGEQLEEAFDSLDEEGVPPELKPGELKSSLSQAGIDLDKIAASVQEAAIFVQGSDRSSLGGAMVVTSSSSEVAEAVASLGTLLRGSGIPGLTAVSGKASGFSVHSPTLGATPIVVVGKGNRVAIGYGLAAALEGITGSGQTLSESASYKAAVTALGKAPIDGFLDGPAALSLAEALVPRSNSEFWEAVPYLKKVSYVGIGRTSSDEVATAKLIAGLK